MPVNVKEEDLRTLLFCSVRYALGRRSYMPSYVQEIAKRYANVLTVDDKRQLAEEIMREDDLARLGDPNIDRPRWLEFVSWLRQHHG